MQDKLWSDGGITMKKIAVFLAVILCTFGIISCTCQDKPKEWTKESITAIFESDAREPWEVVDCVLMSDNAFDMVGAVLFLDNEKESVNVAFMDKDGHYQQCGTYATLSEEADFTYLGNGAVTFKLLAKDGTVYNYTLSISIDGNKVDFTAEDDLTKQQ